MQPNLDEHLTAFILVAERGTLSAAARELGRAVSSVSYSLAQLEAYCGFPLLERGTKPAELTERGACALCRSACCCGACPALHVPRFDSGERRGDAHPNCGRCSVPAFHIARCAEGVLARSRTGAAAVLHKLVQH